MEQTELDTPQVLHGRSAYAAKALELVRAAHSELLLYSDVLDRAFYGGEEFAEAVKQFVLGNQRAHLQVLVNQGQQARHSVPHLLELWRHLSSRIEFREPAEHQRENFRGEWLIADRRTLLERTTPEALESKFWAQAPRHGKVRGDEFEACWNEGQPSPELRSLGI
ncbi:MAG: hypothetical protein P4L83_07525 [Nevskia sp.]|nr:hypothetical protein [Nevskia sp.]